MPPKPTTRAAVKFVEGADDLIEGLGAPFGGLHNGRDLHKEYFSARTDFVLPWFDEIPLLYSHGKDADVALEVVGRVKSRELTDTGAWAKAQLDKQSKYFDAITEMIANGQLYFSSGAMPHLVQTDKKTGEILRWPWIELSLVTTPANLLATVEMAKAVKDFEAAGLETDALSDPLTPAAPPLTKAWHRSLKEMSFEDRRNAIEAMLNPSTPFYSAGPQPYVCICETFDDHVIVSRWDGGDQDYYSIDYTVDPDTEMISLSAPVEVEQTYVPVAVRSVSERPLRASAMDATQLIHAVAGEAKALAERRTKEARVLSSRNHSAVGTVLDAYDAMTEPMTVLRDLHTSTMPDTTAKATDAHLRFLAYTTRLRQLEVV